MGLARHVSNADSSGEHATNAGRPGLGSLGTIPVSAPTHLSDRWLICARGGWLALVLPTLAICLIGFIAAVQEPARVGPPAIARILVGAGLPLSFGLFALLTPVFLAFTTTALVLMWQRSDDWMVVLFSLALFLTGAGGSRFAFTAQTVLPTLHLPVMFLTGVWALMLLLALYLFPDGRFEPRVSAIFAVLTLPLFLVFNNVGEFLVTMPALPDGVPDWQLALVGAALVVNYVLALAGQIYRYLEVSGPVERQQTKWTLVAFGAVLVALAALFGAVLIGLPEDVIAVGILVSTAPVLFLPIAVALAVLHRGLWDVDLVLNRTLLYGTLTIVLGASFVLASLVAQRVVEAQTGQRSDAVTLALAAVVAVAFQPLRRRVAVIVDQVLPARQELALFFTDIVGSTERLAEVGDARWRDVLVQYRVTVRRELRRHRGTEMHIAGDSFFATFADPLRAVRCAEQLRSALRELTVPSRFGLHWGACEMRGEEVSGLAVWAAARVMGTARQDEILLSDAIRAVLEESGATPTWPLEDRGVHPLKGLPGEWHLYAVTQASR